MNNCNSWTKPVESESKKDSIVLMMRSMEQHFIIRSGSLTPEVHLDPLCEGPFHDLRDENVKVVP